MSPIQRDAPSHVPQLDALRGVAVLLVVVGHSLTVPHGFERTRLIANYAWVGVDLFFVLSGFLITGILLDTRSEEHYFRNFYARRTLRIWPVYLMTLALAFIAIPLALPASSLNASGTPAWPYLLMVQNFLPDWGQPLLVPTWSLAIEEQFYLVWPILVWRASRRTVWTMIAVVLITCPVMRFIGEVRGLPYELMYKFTPFRLDGLAAGAAIAMAVREPMLGISLARRMGLVLLLSGAIACAVVFRLAPRFHELRALSFSCVALLFSGTVLLAVVRSIGRRGGLGWLRYTGKVSYCMYLVHQSAFTLMDSLTRVPEYMLLAPVVRELIFAAGGIALTYLVASISWHGFEMPILKLKSHFEARRRATSYDSR